MQKIYSIYFPLNEQTFIEVKAPHKEKDLFRYDEIAIYFFDTLGPTYLVYSHDFAIEAFRRFEGCLLELLENKLVLHPSINPTIPSQDIGYLWNEFLQGKDYLIARYDERESISYWAGERYLLWSASKLCLKTNFASWIYSWQDKIYLEITPVYRWHCPIDRHMDEFKKIISFTSYKKFIKNYHPCLTVEIDKKTAQSWLKKIQSILSTIEANDSKYFTRPLNV